MRAIKNISVSIMGLLCLLFSQQASSQVYLNEGLMVRIDLATQEGGGDWGFRSLVPGFDVSFTYKGHRIQIPSGKSSEKRFSREEYPIPSNFKLNDNEVMLDGFPATNYIAYKTYMKSLGGQIDALTRNVDRGNEDELNKVLQDIDSKIAEINSKVNGFQVSSKFRNKENANSSIEKLRSNREAFANDLERLKKKRETSTVTVSSNSAQKNQSEKFSAEKENIGSRTSDQNAHTSSQTNSANISTIKNENFKTASEFKGGLNDVQEGAYFKDDKGNYFKKEGGGARKVDKAAYDKAEAEKIYAKIAKEEADRQQRSQAVGQLTDDLSGLGANMLSSMQADRDARLDREYAAQSRAQNTIDQFKKAATEGNDEALKQVNNAYYTLAYYNNESKGGWKGTYSEQRKNFLENALSRTHSPLAKDLLIGFYEKRKEQTLVRKRKALTNTIVGPLFGGALLYGGIKGNEYIVMNNDDDDAFMEGIGTTVLIVGVTSGVALGIWGLIDAGKLIGGGKKSKEYQDADSKIRELNERYSLRIYPAYDWRLNASTVNVRLNF